MKKTNRRYLIKITMDPQCDSYAAPRVTSTYLKLNDIIKGYVQLPYMDDICRECLKDDTRNEKLVGLIHNRCIDLIKKGTSYDPATDSPNSIPNSLIDEEKKLIRILLYPGKRDNLNGLKLSETTHNMIVQFEDTTEKFIATESHTNPPSFYQVCASEDIALLYIEALLVDSCMCHYLGISDVAAFHDEKQQISNEKVLFLLEIVNNNDLDYLSNGAQDLVKLVAKKISSSTPYISLLSIFTIAPIDLFNEGIVKPFSYYDDYCKLWSHFQKWYFSRHGRLFERLEDVVDPLGTVLERNKYRGQISASKLEKRIKSIISTPAEIVEKKPFGYEYRYALIIIKHTQTDKDKQSQFETLFPGSLYQSKWDIVYWEDLYKYDDLRSQIEIIPIIIIA